MPQKDAIRTSRSAQRQRPWKQGITLALLILMGLVIALPALATPPKALVLAYNPMTGILTVRISHPTPTPEIHYIKQVEIRKEGQTLLLEEYVNQPNEDPIIYHYWIGPPTGPLLEVTARCNRYGEKTVLLDWSSIGTPTP